MNKLYGFLSVLMFVFVMPACSTSPSSDQLVKVSNPEKANLGNTHQVKNKIYSQYQLWNGVQYQMGGLSKQGVDCSGLVFITYRENFGIELPRTTELMLRTGKEIKRNELRAGDLVLFKTSFKVRHVGIYIEDGKFFHASTSKGVMISNLNDYYWKDKYWHARRVTI